MGAIAQRQTDRAALGAVAGGVGDLIGRARRTAAVLELVVVKLTPNVVGWFCSGRIARPP
jgi:hypothetical protein